MRTAPFRGCKRDARPEPQGTSSRTRLNNGPLRTLDGRQVQRGILGRRKAPGMKSYFDSIRSTVNRPSWFCRIRPVGHPHRMRGRKLERLPQTLRPQSTTTTTPTSRSIKTQTHTTPNAISRRTSHRVLEPSASKCFNLLSSVRVKIGDSVDLPSDKSQIYTVSFLLYQCFFSPGRLRGAGSIGVSGSPPARV